MLTGKQKEMEEKALAVRNIRLAVLLGVVAVSIYLGYIVVYYFK